MATEQKEAALPPNFLQEMTTALSAPVLPGGGCFRPFERDGLAAVGPRDERQKARMVELAAQLSEQDVKRAMLEIMWAWRREDLPYRIAPPLAVGHFLQDVLLEEAGRRGMLQITRLPAQDGTGSGAIASCHPIDRSAAERLEHEDASKVQSEDEYHALLGGMTTAFIRSLPEIEHCACRLFLAGLYFSDWQMRLLPIEDRELLRQSLPSELIERMKAAKGRGGEDVPEAGITAGDNAAEEVETKGDAPKQAQFCHVYLTRLYCAEYRWLQSQAEKERALECTEG